MSLLSRTETTINQLPQRTATFQAQLQSQTNNVDAQYSQLKDMMETAEAYTIELNELGRQVDKFLVKANETDPDQQVYGPSAIKRIHDMSETFKQHHEAWLPVHTQIKTTFEHIKTSKEESDKRIANEKAEQARLAEIERQRVEQERSEIEAKRVQEAERTRLEAEARARQEKEAQLLAAKQAAEKAEQEAEQKRLAVEAAAREDKERQEKAIADKAVADEADAKKKADERARRPPLQKAKEDLIEALDMLYESCISSDYTVAIQMLFKFAHQITANPRDANLRTLHTNNSIIKQRLLEKKGGSEALQAIGFKKAEGNVNDEISIQANADAWNQLTQAKALIEKELEIVKAGRRVNKPSADIQSTSAYPIPTPTPPQRSPEPPAPTSNPNPFAALFNNPGSNLFVPGNFDYSRFLGGLRVPPSSQINQPATGFQSPFSPFPFPSSQSGSAAPAFPGFNPLTLMQNPEFMRHMQTGNLAQALQSMQTPTNTSSPIASPTVAPSAVVQPAAATPAVDERELTEEELLEQALSMSMDEPDNNNTKPSQ